MPDIEIKKGWPRWAKVFLETLEASGGIVTTACQAAKIGRTTAYAYRKTDPEFAQAWEESVYAGSDVLISEAYRRAVLGIPKPIYSKGEYVGDELVYSDQLLIMLLKAARPEYRDRQSVDLATQTDVNVTVEYVDMDPTQNIMLGQVIRPPIGKN